MMKDIVLNIQKTNNIESLIEWIAVSDTRDTLIKQLILNNNGDDVGKLSAANSIPPIKKRKMNKVIDTLSILKVLSIRINVDVPDSLLQSDCSDAPIILNYNEIDKILTIMNTDTIPIWKINLHEMDESDKILSMALFFANLTYSKLIVTKDIENIKKMNNTKLTNKAQRKSLQLKISENIRILNNINKQSKDIKCENLLLNFTKPSSFSITFNLNLKYKPQLFNKFSIETTMFLDLLFSEHEDIVEQEINSTFIERQFITQTIDHTNKELENIAPSFINIPHLKLNLLPFQEKSVQWLLNKEVTYNSHNITDVEVTTQVLKTFLNDKICYGYELILSPSSEHYHFWNKFTNYILNEIEATNLFKMYYTGENKRGMGAKGLLSEEMGLGKTIEILSLLLLNKRHLIKNNPQNTYTDAEGKLITKTKCTLIICPNPLLQQWIDEIQQHTVDNTVKIFHYMGFKDVKEKLNTDNIGEIVENLAAYDIIITTYTVINSEIHYAQYNANQRPRRTQDNSPKYDYSSPLSLMEFFRIILDEVQMLKSDTTQAAKCTSLLHRVHTWGVSGTPIQNIKDFQTVLSYLKIQPFCNSNIAITNVNSNVIKDIKRNKEINSNNEIQRTLNSGIRFSLDNLMNIFIQYDICIRHAKSDIINQIHIPKQTHFLIPLEFNPVEWDNYSNLWNDFIMLSRYGQNGQNEPKLSTNDLNQWLMKLRYLCCHAIIPENIMSLFRSDRNHRNLTKNQKKQIRSNALESDSNPVHNINEILELMTLDAVDLLDSLYRENIQLNIKSAQAKMELQGNPAEAIILLNDLVTKITDDLKTKFEVTNVFEIDSSNTIILQNSNGDKSNINADSKETSKTIRIRSYLDMLHQTYFFLGTAYYFLGSKQLEKVDDLNEKAKLIAEEKKEEAEPLKKYSDIYSMDEMNEIEKNQLQEQNNYEVAEKLRKLILKERVNKIDSVISEVKSYFHKPTSIINEDLTSLRTINFEFGNDFSSNFLISKLFKSLGLMIEALNDQAIQFNELINNLIELLYTPITREYDETNEEEKAEEYCSSIEDQDKIFAFLHCLEELLKNRDKVINMDDDMIKFPEKHLIQIDPNYSEFHIALIKKLNLIKSGTPLKSIFSELKNSRIVRTSLIAGTSKKSNDFEDYLLGHEKEISIINKEIKIIRESIKKLNLIYNSKIEYFGQLQRISDSLVSLIQLEPHVRNLILKEIRGGKKHSENVAKINQTESRVKYLRNLAKVQELIEQNKSFNCAICLNVIKMGSIIKCGHFFCKNCIHNWLKHKNTCPICKRETTIFEIYNFKFQNEIQPNNIEGETVSQISNVDDAKGSSKESTAVSTTTDLNDEELLSLSDKYVPFPQINKVHKITIKENFGAKTDFVIKLILFLKLKNETENHAPPQILLYSQNVEFLKIITKILALNNITYLEGFVNSKNISSTIDKFKNDSSITCLLLNVRTLGTGLNLLNAKHIFLLDPIINHNDELQATSRNNRIGQSEETYVWNFMIKDSVEENIMLYKHMLDNNKKLIEGGASIEDVVEPQVNNADFEINENSTELVADKHLWHCFFRTVQ